jgi:hypothetical protein
MPKELREEELACQVLGGFAVVDRIGRRLTISKNQARGTVLPLQHEPPAQQFVSLGI